VLGEEPPAGRAGSQPRLTFDIDASGAHGYRGRMSSSTVRVYRDRPFRALSTV